MSQHTISLLVCTADAPCSWTMEAELWRHVRHVTKVYYQVPYPFMYIYMYKDTDIDIDRYIYIYKSCGAMYAT